MSNHLSGQKSPYLLQHAEQPVDWYPWGDEAFRIAAETDKPVFLSIGYSTCHWCHVMAEESFADEKIAAAMNDAFVCIKVDREERPDIDNLYMEVAYIMNGTGGWPLNVILTPDKRPIFAATYLPKESIGKIPGMSQIIPRVKYLWLTQREQVELSAEQMKDAIRRSHPQMSEHSLDAELTKMAFRALSEGFDERNGGFGDAPKFPTAHNLLFLLRHDPAKSLPIIERTLSAMRCGGIYDHIEGGFHRYSTDAEWKLPHFEKMLYDQAWILRAYSEAYRVTHSEDYAVVASEIVGYMIERMTGPEGAFYSGEDADSEGLEGVFYFWKEEIIRSALDEKQLRFAESVLDFEPLPHHQLVGDNTLRLGQPPDQSAKEMNLPLDEWYQTWNGIKSVLRAERDKRSRPYRDEKILTDWNAMMIGALADASRVFNRPDWGDLARRGLEYVLTHHFSDNGLIHYRGAKDIPAFIDDYAYLIDALLEVYELDFDVKQIVRAVELTESAIKLLWDEESGGFFMTTDDDNELLIRQKNLADNAYPGGNSVMAHNLMKLFRLTGENRYRRLVEQMASPFYDQMEKYPRAYMHLIAGMDSFYADVPEIVIVGNDSDEWVRAVNNRYMPYRSLSVIDDSNRADWRKISPPNAERTMIDDKTTAYVCHGFACQAPVTAISELSSLLKSEK